MHRGHVLHVPLAAVLAALGTAPLAAGCSTPSQGRKFDDAYVAQIQRGKTTKTDIRKALGDPGSVSSTAEGDVWTCQYSDGGSYWNMVGATYGLTSQKTNLQMLTINFRGDVVRDFTHTVQKAN